MCFQNFNKTIGLFCAVIVLFIGGCGKLPDYSETAFLMDTVVTVKAVCQNETEANKAVRSALDRMKLVADISDRFNDGGEGSLYRLNKHSGQGYVVEKDLFNIISYVKSQGKSQFDCTLAPVTDLWQKKLVLKQLPVSSEINNALRYCGQDKVKITSDMKVVLNKGTTLDLGGIAKGYGVDVAYDVLMEQKVNSALINAGGNVRVLGKKSDGQNWRIGVQSPTDKDKLLTVINLPEGKSVATSGDYQRYTEINGVRYHHLLNPSDGYPGRFNRSATVVAATAMEADYYSTVFFLMKADEAIKLAEKKCLDILIVTADGQQKCSCNWHKLKVQKL